MGRDAEKTRIKELRESVIEAMRNSVKEHPEKYDPDRLQAAIDAIDKVKDSNLDAWLILGKHMAILMRQISFSKEELDKIRAVFKELDCEVLMDFQGKQERRDRDDWYWKLKTPTIAKYAVSVTKWNHKDPYVLGACGKCGWGWRALCTFEHKDIDTLVKHIRCILNEDIQYGEDD